MWVVEGVSAPFCSPRLCVCVSVDDQVGSICKKMLPPHNAPLIMEACGSKGSALNICQMMACVGQQAVRATQSLRVSRTAFGSGAVSTLHPAVFVTRWSRRCACAVVDQVNGARIQEGFLDRTLPMFQHKVRCACACVATAGCCNRSCAGGCVAGERPRREGLRHELVLHRSEGHGVLLPHHGWPRGSRGHCREDCADGVHAAPHGQGAVLCTCRPDVCASGSVSLPSSLGVLCSLIVSPLSLCGVARAHTHTLNTTPSRRVVRPV